MSTVTHLSYSHWCQIVQHTAALNESRSHTLPTLDAHGALLAAPLVAHTNAPAFPMSAMDGFAARHRDIVNAFAQAARTQERPMLEVSGDLAAGATLRGQIREGAAIRIMTGAPVPEEFDLVIPVEATDAEPHAAHPPARITLTRKLEGRAAKNATGTGLEPGAHIRASGEEVPRGMELAPAGARLSAPLVGLALAVGVTRVQVQQPRTVAIIMTGDELVTEHHPSESEPHGAVLESNGPMLAAALAELGVQASILHVADSSADLVGLARSLAPRHDLLLTTGGVGSGARDVVKAAFGSAGLACSRFEHLALRPGGPQGVGRLEVGAAGEVGARSTPMVHLPGTPVGAFVGFHLFVRPLFTDGPAGFPLPPGALTVEGRQRPKPGTTVRPAHLRVVNGSLHATEVAGPRLRPFATANALLLTDGATDGAVTHGAANGPAGDTVTVIPLAPTWPA